MFFDPIRVISRPKISGLGTHFGVLFPEGLVYDYTSELGLRRITQDQFSEGKQVAIVREIPWHMAPIVRTRLEYIRRNAPKYSLLEWNCETFAEWLTSGIGKSAQVTGVSLLTGIVIITLALAGSG